MGERSFLRPVGYGRLASSSVMGWNRCFRIKGMNNRGYLRPHFCVNVRAWARPTLTFSGLLELIASFCNLSVEVFCLMKTHSFSTSSLFHILSGPVACIDQP